MKKYYFNMRYTLWLDLASVLSAFAVVVLHINGVYWLHPKGIIWIGASFLESVCYFAVPIFFMISGATLLEYTTRYSDKNYFSKRIKRTVIPFFVWSSVAWLVYGEYRNIFDTFSEIVSYKYIAIYWFFPVLWGLYLSIPILARVNNKIYICKYITCFSFVIYSVFPFIRSITGLAFFDLFQFPAGGGTLFL